VAYQKDYYAILQVPRNASQDQIERAYQRLAALYDPKTSRKNRAEQRYADIQEAYSALSSRGRRREHDKTLAGRAASAGSMSPSEVISNRFVLISAGVIIASIVVILVAVLTLAGGGGGGSPSVTPLATFTPQGPTATPLPTPEGPTPSPAPSTAPDVQGEPTTTADGLQYIEVIPGTGIQPAATDRIEIWYTGYLQSADPAGRTKFDASVDRGVPYESVANQFIPGFTEGLLLMKEGGTSRFIIPPELGYGAAGSGSRIPPNSTLIFDVTLIKVAPGPTATPTAAPSDTTAADTPTPTVTAVP